MTFNVMCRDCKLTVLEDVDVRVTRENVFVLCQSCYHKRLDRETVKKEIDKIVWEFIDREENEATIAIIGMLQQELKDHLGLNDDSFDTGKPNWEWNDDGGCKI